MESPLIFLDDAPRARARWFHDPCAIHCAHTPEEALQGLDALDEARAAGRYIAGFASYELGLVLEPALRPSAPERPKTPYYVFGEFACFEETPSPDLSALPALTICATPSLSRQTYERQFRSVKRLIEAGEVYQVNLAFPLVLEGALSDPMALYATGRARQNAAFGAVVALGEPKIVSWSPELFFAIDQTGRIRTRPMKGTAPRGASAEEDEAVCRALQADAKSRAENLMIVDLLRNDLGRLCTIGSVSLARLFHVESYPTLHQMVSQVEGVLGAHRSLGALFHALFPCGSVTGAPKIRAMEVIHALERYERGAYCGAIGWFAPDGSACFSVAIRTASVFADGYAVLPAGSGLVHDSECEREYEECLLKARFLLPELTPPR